MLGLQKGMQPATPRGRTYHPEVRGNVLQTNRLQQTPIPKEESMPRGERQHMTIDEEMAERDAKLAAAVEKRRAKVEAEEKNLPVHCQPVSMFPGDAAVAKP